MGQSVGLETVRRVKVGGHGRQELGAGVGETRLEFRQLWLAARLDRLNPRNHFAHLVRVVLLVEHRLQGLVDLLGVQDQTDGQKDVHLISLFVDLVVLVRLCLNEGQRKTFHRTIKLPSMTLKRTWNIPLVL